MEKMFVSQTPLLRVGVPEDIALIASFLTSEEAYWLTGKSFWQAEVSVSRFALSNYLTQ
jgi:NAD(P)-dependent dehydrogenase (short-subunit alcohol dehydrogenase family)